MSRVTSSCCAGAIVAVSVAVTVVARGVVAVTVAVFVISSDCAAEGRSDSAIVSDCPAASAPNPEILRELSVLVTVGVIAVAPNRATAVPSI